MAVAFHNVYLDYALHPKALTLLLSSLKQTSLVDDFQEALAKAETLLRAFMHPSVLDWPAPHSIQHGSAAEGAAPSPPLFLLLGLSAKQEFILQAASQVCLALLRLSKLSLQRLQALIPAASHQFLLLLTLVSLYPHDCCSELSREQPWSNPLILFHRWSLTADALSLLSSTPTTSLDAERHSLFREGSNELKPQTAPVMVKWELWIHPEQSSLWLQQWRQQEGLDADPRLRDLLMFQAQLDLEWTAYRLLLHGQAPCGDHERVRETRDRLQSFLFLSKAQQQQLKDDGKRPGWSTVTLKLLEQKCAALAALLQKEQPTADRDGDEEDAPFTHGSAEEEWVLYEQALQQLHEETGASAAVAHGLRWLWTQCQDQRHGQFQLEEMPKQIQATLLKVSEICVQRFQEVLIPLVLADAFHSVQHGLRWSREALTRYYRIPPSYRTYIRSLAVQEWILHAYYSRYRLEEYDRWKQALQSIEQPGSLKDTLHFLLREWEMRQERVSRDPELLTERSLVGCEL